MKKLMILSVASLGLLAASCAKSRTCTCTASVNKVTFTDYANNTIFNDDTQTDVYSTTSTETIDKLKKKDARRKYTCYGGSSTEVEVSQGGSGNSAYTKTETTTTTGDCTLK
ncbi:MAG: hypothetical protein V4506_14575 [Bacteroidota bacterium]